MKTPAAAAPRAKMAPRTPVVRLLGIRMFFISLGRLILWAQPLELLLSVASVTSGGGLIAFRTSTGSQVLRRHLRFAVIYGGHPSLRSSRSSEYAFSRHLRTERRRLRTARARAPALEGRGPPPPRGARWGSGRPGRWSAG